MWRGASWQGVAEPEGLETGGISMGSPTPWGLGGSVQGGDCYNESRGAGFPLAEKGTANK